MLEHERVGSVEAIDIDPEMLAQARIRLKRFGTRARFRRCSFDAPLPKCDAVATSLALHHVLKSNDSPTTDLKGEQNRSPAQKKPNETEGSEPPSEQNRSPEPPPPESQRGSSPSPAPAKQAKHAAVRFSHKKIAKQIAPIARNLSKPHSRMRTITAQEPAPRAEYFCGVAMGLTLDRVGARADITAKGKSIAMTLASHFPTVKPTKARLSRLTGLSRATVTRALIELKDKHLLTWTRGNSSAANRYECFWLTG